MDTDRMTPGISKRRIAALGWLATLALATTAQAAEQPLAIFHAFDQSFSDVEGYVCDLASQGFSHVQLSPAQKSNPGDKWWARYQPVDFSVIQGKGSAADLKRLTQKAHGCGVKVIADVVFNHMANMDEFKNLNFPGLKASSFHPRCSINYNDGNRDTETRCWLGGNGDLPDLDQSDRAVERIQKAHLKKLLSLGIDGFRFDAAKHMPPEALRKYLDYINSQSHDAAWNYLEVIEDDDTKGEVYTPVAAITDFRLFRTLRSAFMMNGDLRNLRSQLASGGFVNDPRNVTFGRNHDNIKEISDGAIDPYTDRTDSFLATALVLARETGTPLILNWDNYDNAFIRYGVKFRQIMRQRGVAGENVKENVLAVIDSPTALMMERGNQGFFVVNKATSKLDLKTLDMTLTSLEGCYRELRNNFLVAIERRNDKKYVTRWGTWSRGGIEVQGRDALYFIREPWTQCQTR